MESIKSNTIHQNSLPRDIMILTSC